MSYLKLIYDALLEPYNGLQPVYGDTIRLTCEDASWFVWLLILHQNGGGRGQRRVQNSGEADMTFSFKPLCVDMAASLILGLCW